MTTRDNAKMLHWCQTGNVWFETEFEDCILLSRLYTKIANTRRNFAEFSRELLLHNYTLVCMEAVYIPRARICQTLAERKLICKMLQELARMLARTIKLIDLKF